MEKNLVATVFNFPPFFSIVPEKGGNLTFSGFGVDTYSWLSAFLKIQITYAVVDVQIYGTTQAIINQLLNNETDIFMTGVVPTLERIKLMDFTHPITKGDFCLMLPYPDKESNSVVAIFHIFTPQVGAATFMLLLIGISFICVYQYGYLTSESKSIVSTFDFVGRRILYFVIIFSGRSGCGNYFTFPYTTRFAVRLVLGVWILMISVALVIFTNFLTSHHTVSKSSRIVNSLQELAASPQYKLVVPIDSDLADIFLNAETEPYKSLGKSLKKQKPSITVANLTTQLYNVLLERNGAYLQDAWVTQILIGRDMNKNDGRCRFTQSRILKEISKMYPLALRKGDPNVELINKGLMRLRESGLMDHWINFYMGDIDKCRMKGKISLQDEISSFKAMNISHHVGTFLIVVFGSALAFFSFLCELIFYKVTTKKEEIKEPVLLDGLLPSFELGAQIGLELKVDDITENPVVSKELFSSQ